MLNCSQLGSKQEDTGREVWNQQTAQGQIAIGRVGQFSISANTVSLQFNSWSARPRVHLRSLLAPTLSLELPIDREFFARARNHPGDALSLDECIQSAQLPLLYGLVDFLHFLH
ncbi:hypothetical protein D3C85_780490 [compost metagenome]